MKSKLMSLNLRDFAKSATVFIVTTVLSAVYTSIKQEGLPVDGAAWLSVVKPSLLASGGYIIKNFLTNSKDAFLKKEIL